MEFAKTRLFCVSIHACRCSDEVFTPGILFHLVIEQSRGAKKSGEKLGVEPGEGAQAVMDERRLQRKNEGAGVITKTTKGRDGG